MANSIYLSPKSKVRRNKEKVAQENLMVSSAKYFHDFTIAISFTNGKTSLVDFLPLFQKHVKGGNIKYFAPQNFKKFIVKNGNIYWGRNEDIIFPVSLFVHDEESHSEEEVLYII